MKTPPLLTPGTEFIAVSEKPAFYVIPLTTVVGMLVEFQLFAETLYG